MITQEEKDAWLLAEEVFRKAADGYKGRVAVNVRGAAYFMWHSDGLWLGLLSKKNVAVTACEDDLVRNRAAAKLGDLLAELRRAVAEAGATEAATCAHTAQILRATLAAEKERACATKDA